MATSGAQKTMVVTGSSSGIGEAVAVSFAKDGWTVFACVRKPDDAKRLQESHTNIRPVLVDVTSAEQVTKAFEEVRTAVGEHGLDVLINNAGRAYTGPTEFIPMTDVVQQFDVNVYGVIRVTQAAMPLLRLGQPGRIIMLGSIADELNFPYGGVYCASKAAVQSWSECLRREVARWGIKVSLLKPGPVKTNLEKTSLQLGAQFREKFPPGTPCHDYYGRDMEHYEKAAEPFTENAAPVSKVVNTIRSILSAKNPKNIYYDTWGTYFMVTMVSWMPVWMWDRQIGNVFIVKD